MKATDPSIVEELTAQKIFECVNRPICFIYFVDARHLNQPANVVRINLVIDDPFGQFIPFVGGTPIDANSPFNVLQHYFSPCNDEIHRLTIPDTLFVPNRS